MIYLVEVISKFPYITNLQDISGQYHNIYLPVHEIWLYCQMEKELAHAASLSRIVGDVPMGVQEIRDC